MHPEVYPEHYIIVRLGVESERPVLNRVRREIGKSGEARRTCSYLQDKVQSTDASADPETDSVKHHNHGYNLKAATLGNLAHDFETLQRVTTNVTH